MINNYWINVDKLKLCYTATDEVLNYLYSTNKYINSGYNFQLIKLDSKVEGYTTFRIDYTPTNNNYSVFGVINMGYRYKDSECNYIWVEVDNKTLYTTLSNGERALTLLPYITNSIGIEFNNISVVDIALDTDKKDIKKRIVKHIKKHTPIIYGKAISNTEETIGLAHCPITKKGIIKHKGELTFKGAKKQLIVYNKTDEIKDSGKYYITYDTDKPISRIEIRLTSTTLNNYYVKGNYYTQSEILEGVINGDDEMLYKLWSDNVNNSLYFKTDEGKILNILDLPR